MQINMQTTVRNYHLLVLIFKGYERTEKGTYYKTSNNHKACSFLTLKRANNDFPGP